ncbi:MAG TPA: endonuclease/exonuclease/phosphatase family protein [Rhodothermales bacterium]
MRWAVSIGAALLLGTTCVGAQTSDATLRIVTWNTTWLAHPDFPPVDDAAQVANAIRTLRAIPADVFILQEIASPQAFQALVEGLGSGYSGILARTGDELRMGLIYRTESSRVDWVSEEPLWEQAFDFADRPPLFVRLRFASSEETLLLILVHLKAYADEQSFERRLRAVEALKATLDAERPGHAVVAGDFNDGIARSIAPGRDSPLRSFRLDSLRYVIPTARLESAGENTFCASATCAQGGTFDHFILTASLNAWQPQVRRVDGVLDLLPGFVASTSDHLPVLLTLRPPVEVGVRLTGGVVLESVYPNPFSDGFTVRYSIEEPAVTFELVDVLGRVQFSVVGREFGSEATMRLETGRIPAGVYVLRARTASSAATVRVVRVP